MKWTAAGCLIFIVSTQWCMPLFAEELEHLAITMRLENESESLIVVCDLMAPRGTVVNLPSIRSFDPHSAPLEDAIKKVLKHQGHLEPVKASQTLTAVLKANDFDGDDCLAPLELAPHLLQWRPQPSATDREKVPAKLFVRLDPQLAAELAAPTAWAARSLKVSGQPADFLLTAQLVEQQIKLIELVDFKKFVANPNNDAVQLLPAKLPHNRLVMRQGTLQLELDFVRRTAEATLPSPGPNVICLDSRLGRPGWFECLDQDGNGRLSRPELRQADEVLPVGEEPDSFQIVSLSLTCGPTSGARGIVLLPESIRGKGPPAEVPDWFQSMDQNADGILSKEEFLGSTEKFRELDSDRDAELSVDDF